MEVGGSAGSHSHDSALRVSLCWNAEASTPEGEGAPRYSGSTFSCAERQRDVSA